MTARPRRRRTGSLSSSPASVRGIPAKKPPQSVRPVPVHSFIKLHDLEASTDHWSAVVVVMCVVCGWDMDMTGAAAYCTNPRCKRRTRLYHVELKIIEVDEVRA